MLFYSKNYTYIRCTYNFEHSLNDEKYFLLETKWLVSTLLNEKVGYI